MSKLVDRIRKLLNLAGNDGASENEADVARQLAEQLMKVHGISEADLGDAPGVDPATTVREQTSPIDGRQEMAYAGIVASAIARVVGCTAFASRRPNRREKCNGCDRIAGDHEHFFEAGPCIVWVGSDAQRVQATELYAWVMRQIDRLGGGARASAKSSGHPRQWMRAYKMGVASAIAKQAIEMVTYRAQFTVHDTKALVMRDNVQRAISAYLVANNIHIRQRTRRARGDAYAAGRNDGSSVSMRHSMTGGHKRLGSG